MPTGISEGSPEFARFFNHSHLWKLQSSITAECSAIELLRNMRPTHGPEGVCVGRGMIFITDAGWGVKRGQVGAEAGRYRRPCLARGAKVREYL
jgi:hypothetical protein